MVNYIFCLRQTKQSEDTDEVLGTWDGHTFLIRCSFIWCSRGDRRVRRTCLVRDTSTGPYQLEKELQVLVLQHGVHALHLVGDATLRVIQALDEVVSVLRHQVGETKERIRFSVL